MTNTTGQFTIEYLHSEIASFLTMMGLKPFWEDSPEADRRRDAAIKGLTFCYTNTKTTTDKEEEQVRQSFETAIDQFNRRKDMIFRIKIRNLISQLRA